LEVKAIEKKDLLVIQKLAEETWPDTFRDILSKEQIRYMLDWMYSLKTLESQFDQGHQFYIYYEQNSPVGFIGVEAGNPTDKAVKIHKIYILPSTQGKGIGKHLIDFVRYKYRSEGWVHLFLNVNRFNKAVDFYKHIGFTIEYTEDIDIGEGFLMEDYVMKLNLIES
jgi:diamine N-acetyltransferase